MNKTLIDFFRRCIAGLKIITKRPLKFWIANQTNFLVTHLCCLFLLLPIHIHAQQHLPEKIRGYKVYQAEISVTNINSEIKAESEIFVKVGEPELTGVSLTGITLEISAEILSAQQSGTIDFLAFRDFRVNDLAIEIEEYKESFSFKRNQPTHLPKPVKIFLGARQTLRGAFEEINRSKDEWQVTGRVFVFGRFKKFGFAFKRVVPVAIDIRVKNPLRRKSVSN